MKKLGVIGGMGPMATAYFLKMIVEMTDAEQDQDHIETVLYHVPGIPDRTDYILGKSKKSPVPPIVELGSRLAEEGVQVIAIPCITVNHFYVQLSEQIPVTIIDIVQELCDYLKKHSYLRAGLMATTGTVKSGLFQSAFDKNQMKLILPSEEKQADVMSVIYGNIKASKPVDMECFLGVSEELFSAGAQVVILGCTELSVVMEDYRPGGNYLDAMRLLAQRVVRECGKLKKEYEELIG